MEEPHGEGSSTRAVRLAALGWTFLGETDIAETTFEGQCAAAKNFGSWPLPIATAVAHADENPAAFFELHLAALGQLERGTHPCRRGQQPASHKGDCHRAKMTPWTAAMR
jgi:hypothetical protein